MSGLTGSLADASRLARLRLTIARPDDGVVLTWPLPPGDQGVIDTLAAMRGVVIDAAKSSEVRELAALRELGALFGNRRGWLLPDSADHGMLAAALFDYLKRKVMFARDPRGLELLRHPVGMIRAMGWHTAAIGDCDDRAMLGASLAVACGLKTSFIVIGQDAGGPYQHVYFGVRGTDDPRLIPIDPQETNRVGEEADHARRMEYPI